MFDNKLADSYDGMSDAVWEDFRQTVSRTARRQRMANAASSKSGIIRKSKRPAIRGETSPSTCLDLHGLSLHDAWQVLLAFIAAHHSYGSRQVTVITGQGSDSSPETLSSSLPRWCAVNPIARYIRSVTPKAAHQGGRGAWQITLHKRK